MQTGLPAAPSPIRTQRRRSGAALLAAAGVVAGLSLAGCEGGGGSAASGTSPAPASASATAGPGAPGGTAGRAGEPGAGGAEATQPAPSPAIPVDGPVDVTLPASGTGAVDIQRYDLTLDYGMGTTGLLTGRAKIALTARTDLPSFPLDLRGYSVSSVTVDGKPATVKAQENRIGITPATPLKKGQEATVEVSYAGRPPQYVDESGAACGFVVRRGAVAAVNEPNCASTWFPTNDAPWDKARFVISTSVPKGWSVAGNGKLLSQTPDGNNTVFTWDSVDPMASYLATASIGRFELKRSTSPSGVEIINMVDPKVAAKDVAVLDRTGEMLTFLEERNGAYPLTNVGSILSAADVNYQLETQTRIFLGSSTDPSTLLHELNHQWWGNSVTPRSWSDVWINEGACTYAEWEWAQAHGGPSAAAKASSVMARPAGDPFWQTKLTAPGPARLFSDPVYLRSAAFFARLRTELGDERFGRLRQRWLADHKHGTGSTEQFQALASELAGKDLTPLFDAWVRSATKPTA